MNEQPKQSAPARTESIEERAALTGLGAWLGAVLERLKRGEPPLSGEVSQENMEHDAERFGAVAWYRVPKWCRAEARPNGALDRLLRDVHLAAREQPWEQAFWESLLLLVPMRLPPAVAHELLDRMSGSHFDGALAHRMEDDSVLWRLVDEHPEATCNLATRRYTSDKYTWDRLEEVLHPFPQRWGEVGHHLSVKAPSSHDKAVQLVARLKSLGQVQDVQLTRRWWNDSFRCAWEGETEA